MYLQIVQNIYKNTIVNIASFQHLRILNIILTLKRLSIDAFLNILHIQKIDNIMQTNPISCSVLWLSPVIPNNKLNTYNSTQNTKGEQSCHHLQWKINLHISIPAVKMLIDTPFNVGVSTQKWAILHRIAKRRKKDSSNTVVKTNQIHLSDSLTLC